MNNTNHINLAVKIIYGGIFFMILLIASDYLGENSKVNQAQNHLDNALMLRNNRQYEEAIVEYSIAIDLNSRFASAFQGRCNALVQINQYQSAIEDCNRSLELDRELTQTYSIRCVAYAGLGDYEHAEEDCNEALFWHPNDSATYNNLGHLQTFAGDYTSSIENYTLAIELNPFEAILYYNRGIPHLRLGNYEDAISDFEEAVSLSNNLPLAHRNLILALQSSNQIDEAFLASDNMILNFPNEASGYAMRGGLHTDANNLEIAVEDLLHAIELNETFSYAYVQLGHAYRGLEQFAKAKIAYCQYLELSEEYRQDIIDWVEDNSGCD